MCNIMTKEKVGTSIDKDKEIRFLCSHYGSKTKKKAIKAIGH